MSLFHDLLHELIAPLVITWFAWWLNHHDNDRK